MSLPILTVVAAALINNNDEILMSCRPIGKPMAGMWEFPGGKIEPYESPETALSRELFEEIGISVDPKNMHPVQFASHSYADFHLLMPLFLIRKWTGEPFPKENQKLKWESVHTIKVCDMPPPDGPLLESVKNFLRTPEIDKC